MELKETVELMNSINYEDRFKAEFAQLSIRIEGLETMILGYKADTLAFKPVSDVSVFEAQLAAMKAYAAILHLRAKEESIEL